MNGPYCDFHSHLLPGVDDGARTLDESLQAIDRMVDAGIDRIITTPHFTASVTRDERAFGRVMEVMDDAWALVWKAASARHPTLDFRRGHEVMLDVPDPDLSDRRLHLGGTPFVLVEWPRLHIPPGTVEVLSRLRQAGHLPVVAHPERYIGVDRGLDILRSWKQAGAFLQGNYGSLVGKYGPAARTLIVELLEEGLLDYLSSDFHGRKEYTLYLEQGVAEVLGMNGEQQVELLGSANPARLLRGEVPLPVPPLYVEKSFLRRLREWISG